MVYTSGMYKQVDIAGRELDHIHKNCAFYDQILNFAMLIGMTKEISKTTGYKLTAPPGGR